MEGNSFIALFLHNEMNLHETLLRNANREKAAISQRFFKTGEGEYAHGDIFLGLTVPKQREIAKQFSDLPLAELQKHLTSKYHEERLTTLLILVNQYHKKPELREAIYVMYLNHTKYVNNWDLVDSSADKIVGAHAYEHGTAILTKLANSKNLWEKRIAMVATYYFIKKNEFKEPLAIAEILCNDTHDLLHKAVGWMLREVGKRDKKTLVTFLTTHYKTLPRTLLRYAIEKFPENERQAYLKGKK